MDATANNAVSAKPNKAKEMMMRLRSRRRNFAGFMRAEGSAKCQLDASGRRLEQSVCRRIRIDHAIADAVTRLDQCLVERLVDRGAQAVDVHAQAVAVGQLLAPDAR